MIVEEYDLYFVGHLRKMNPLLDVGVRAWYILANTKWVNKEAQPFWKNYGCKTLPFIEMHVYLLPGAVTRSPDCKFQLHLLLNINWELVRFGTIFVSFTCETGPWVSTQTLVLLSGRHIDAHRKFNLLMEKLMVKSEGECNLLKSNSGTSLWRNNNSYWWTEFQDRRTRTRRREKSDTHPKFRDKIASARKTSSRGPIDYFFACYRENGNAPKSTDNLPNTPP